VYCLKTDPMRDYEKNLTRKGSDTEIIPSCAKYRLTCSMELDPSDPLNLVNLGVDTWVVEESGHNHWDTA
jgi:hypothetical protein